MTAERLVTGERRVDGRGRWHAGAGLPGDGSALVVLAYLEGLAPNKGEGVLHEQGLAPRARERPHTRQRGGAGVRALRTLM